MQINIKEEEKTEVLVSIASCALELLKEVHGDEYIVIHNDDGTCLKTGVNEEKGLWVMKYTEDDPAVE